VLSENTYLSAIRAGMVSVVPLTIIGGLFLIIAYFPVAGWDAIVEPYRPFLLVPKAATFGVLGVFACFFIAYDLGKQFKQEAIVSAAMATTVFLMIQMNAAGEYAVKQESESSISLDEKTPFTLTQNDLVNRDEPFLSMDGLGSEGLFTAILIAIVTVRIQKLFTDLNLVIRLPENVPPVVSESFLSLVPLLFLVVVFWIIRFWLGVDINATLEYLLSPVKQALNTMPGILLYAFLVTMLWSIGINGDNAMDAIVAPIFLQFLDAKVDAMTAGQPLPYVTAYGFFTAFVNVGGTGATIALALMLLNSKEPGFRIVSRLSLPTQVFQINEPIFFGIPIVLNPIFMVPYILNALVLTASTYVLMDWNVIHKPFVNVPWTTPPIIGHYLVTGGDWKAAVWGAISILIAMTIYYPFAKVAERQRLRAEVKGVAEA
jgi:PTS system cellobiose-specific IIC component